MITDKRIGVIAGGTSAEREVSMRSGRAIYNSLLGIGYNAVFIDAAENLCEILKEENIEIAFMALHGGSGENGAVQGLLEIMEIPYTGSGILASALAMNKEMSKKIFIYHDISAPPFATVDIKQAGTRDKINVQFITTIVDFPLPWVVKPVSEGSSIGVGMVKNEDDIESAFEEAFSYGDRVIIEKYIAGKEIQIGVLGNKALGGVEVRPSQEFYNYEAKYTPGLTQYILPPEINDSAYGTLKAMALKAHKALGCKGATRVDLILDESNNPFLLEVNTIPGMTETSLLPKIAKHAGLEFPDLLEEMLSQTLKGN